MTVTPPVHDRGVRSAAGYNPWADLRSRPHLTLKWARFKDCREQIRDTPSGRVIYLSHGSKRAERRSLLTHALVHDERFLFKPGTPTALCAKEEAIVRDETAYRLVPPDELRAYLAECEAADEPVHAFMVAEEFTVTMVVAQRALSLLERRHRLYRQSTSTREAS